MWSVRRDNVCFVPKADIRRHLRDVRFAPGGIAYASQNALLLAQITS
jgi:hypothetical protein